MKFFIFFAFAAGLCLPGAALAQSISFGPEARVNSPMPTVEQSKEPDDGRARLARNSGKLFDLMRSTTSLQLDAGPLWYRPQAGSENFERGTGEIGVGGVVTSPWGPFYLAGHHRMVFRAFDAKSYAFTPLQSNLATGVKWGIFELESRIGLSVLGISAFRGDWSLDVLSPRVGVGAALHLGRFRIDIQAHSEYLWRWFGPDYLARGITLGLRLDLPTTTPVVTRAAR